MGLLFWKSARFFGRFLLGFIAAQKFDGSGFFGFVAVFGITLGAAQFGAFFGFFDLARFEVFAVVGGDELVLLRLRFGHGFGNQIHGVECGAWCGCLGLRLCGLFGFDGGFALRQQGFAFGIVVLFARGMAFKTALCVFGGGKARLQRC